MIDVPAAVTAALEQRRKSGAQEPGVSNQSSGVSVGGLHLIGPLTHSSADQRIGLVLRVDSPNDFVEVLLIHTSPELATNRDVILPASATGAPYDTVAQTDLRAVVWSFQLGQRVGHLDDRDLAAVKAVGTVAVTGQLTDPASAGMTEFQTGTPLAGPLDRRWSFKESEGDALRRLASDCTEALLDQDLVWGVDHRLLQPELLDHADDLTLLIPELLHWVQTRDVTMTVDDLELLMAVGALDIESWIQIGDIGMDLFTSLQGIALRAATGVHTTARTELRCVLTATYLEPIDRNEELDRVHYLAAKEPMAS